MLPIAANNLVAVVGVAILTSLSAVAPSAAHDQLTVTWARITSNGLDIYYEVHGELSPDETPVLLLHGGMGS
ncbi:MAG: alpha/beta fold hydrolase, partial [Shinella sp.]